MTKTKLKLYLENYNERYKEDRYAGNVIGINRKCEKKDKVHIELYLKSFKLYKNFNFDKFVVKLNYFYMVEYICAQTDICNMFDDSRCNYFCWIKQTINKMGFTPYKRSL